MKFLKRKKEKKGFVDPFKSGFIRSTEFGLIVDSKSDITGQWDGMLLSMQVT